MAVEDAPPRSPRWAELPVRSLVALATVATAVILLQATIATLARAGHPIGALLGVGAWERNSGALATTAMLSMGGLFVLQRWRLDVRALDIPRIRWAIPTAVVALALGLAFDLLASQDAVLALMAAGQVLDVLAILLFVLALGLDSRALAVRDHDGAVWLGVGLFALIALKTASVYHPAIPEHGWLWVVPVAYPFAWAIMWDVWAPDPSSPSMVRRNLNLLAVAIYLMPLPMLLVPLAWRTSLNGLVPIFHLVAVVAVVLTFGQLILATIAHRGASGVRAERWIVAVGLLWMVKAGLPDPLHPGVEPLSFFNRFEFHEPQAVAGALIVLLGAFRSWLRRRGEALTPLWTEAVRVALLSGWAILDIVRRFGLSEAIATGERTSAEVVRATAWAGSALVLAYMISLVPLIPVVSRILRGTSAGSHVDEVDEVVSPG